jgi:hypothetical protein
LTTAESDVALSNLSWFQPHQELDSVDVYRLNQPFLRWVILRRNKETVEMREKAAANCTKGMIAAFWFISLVSIFAFGAGSVGDVHAQSSGTYSLWSGTAVPAQPAVTDGVALELGVKFRSDVSGTITGLRFYKGSANTGQHVGHLWDRNGTLLATAVFSSETASGWQEVALSAPVAITANTTYVASYYSPTGYFAVNHAYFSGTGVDSAPLHALSDGVDGGNGVYRVGSSGFPTQTYNSNNYWVDVVFKVGTLSDKTPPTLSSVSPITGATGVNIGTTVAVTFSETMNPGTISSTNFVLRDGSNTIVPCGLVYNAGTNTATLSPDSSLSSLTAYTATIKGGTGGVADLAGNSLPADISWTFTTAATLGEGPGGPILIIASASNPFSRYYTEILRAEGLNSFAVSDISAVSAATLASYDVVLLGEVALTSTQVTMLSNWVGTGGNLITMRPDKKLAALLGLVDMHSTLSEGYLKVATSSGPGAGIVSETIQFHGTADLYAEGDATTLATLYLDATTESASPAVTLRTVGANGGQVAAFTYDLARSVVLTREGNPAWIGQDRDGYEVIESDDLFYGNAPFDPQPDYVDFGKIAIPQADEQQRLLANLVTQMGFDKKPLPRFWYFPRGLKAVVVMTGDDHAYGDASVSGTAGRFDANLAASSSGCSVDNWECIRSTSYLLLNTALTDAQAAYYDALGFEVALHVNSADGTYANCADWTPTTLESFYTDQMSTFSALYPSVSNPVTERNHCVSWSDYDTMPQVELRHGSRLDTNYYYFPDSFVQDRPGFFTGSGLPMRFAKLDGTLVDVYQVVTQMTDESGQTYPFTIDSLLDKALGPQGYYGVFTANMHTDHAASAGSDAIISSAKARGVPVISARQLLKWLDGRNNSSFGSLNWDGTNLSFTVTAASGSNGLQAMVPSFENFKVSSIIHEGNSVNYATKTIKGIEYAFFAVETGAYLVTYAVDTTPPSVSSVSPLSNAVGVGLSVNISAVFSEAMDPATINTSTVVLRDAGNVDIPATVTYSADTQTITLDPISRLTASTTYTATILGGNGGVTDIAGNPMSASFTWSFNTAVTNVNYSIWSTTATPTMAAVTDGIPLELGVKFRSDVNGVITGLRFYKGAANKGEHVGHLWDSNGNLLATAVFTNETASGWQEMALSAPVSIAANTTYIASYYSPTGYFAVSHAYFSGAGVDNPPLHALSNGLDGGNGVYHTSSSGFPTQTWNANNYWVDVVFQQ